MILVYVTPSLLDPSIFDKEIALKLIVVCKIVMTKGDLQNVTISVRESIGL